MKIAPKKILKGFLIIFLGVLGLLLGVLHFIDFGMTGEEIAERFAEAGVSYTEHQDEDISWVVSGNPDGLPLLFIHGSPGSWDNFIEYMCDPELTKRFQLISVNRLGYGEKSVAVPSLSRQAEPIAKLLPTGSRAILIGHSMGAPIAVRLAMDFPEKVQKLILLSGALDPELEKVTWYQKLAEWPLVTWMLPDVLVVCNREIMPLKAELIKMESLWPELPHPVIAVHGTEDSLVPVENMDYLKKQHPEDQVDIHLIPGANHFIPWTHFLEIKQVILNAVD